jgi:hypothetical protein
MRLHSRRPEHDTEPAAAASRQVAAVERPRPLYFLDSLMPSGRLMSTFRFDFGPTSFFAITSCSVNRASRISPSVARLRS